MHIKRLSTTLILGLILTLGLVASLSLAAPGNPDPDPDPNTYTAPPTTTVSLTYDEDMDAASVSTQTFAVHAFQTGLLTATYGVRGGSIIVTPTRPFFPGELVQTTATTQTRSITGEQPLSYTVWGFRAAAGSGSGRFSFSSGNNFGSGNDPTWALALGDVDGDGDLDLVVGNSGQQNVVYLNDGDGTFDSASYNFGGNDHTHALALGDVDGDGDLDLAVSNAGHQDVVYLNDGDGNPFDTTSYNFGPDPAYTYALALGDVDGDGDLDLAVGNAGAGQNVVYLNDGDGTFDSTSYNFGVGNTWSLAQGDVDGDGDLDLATGLDYGQGMVYLNDGDGTFDTTSYNFGPGTAHTYALALGDVDGDGDLDLAAGTARQNVVYLNDGDGTFDSTSYNFGSGSDDTLALTQGDVDGDGDLDLVTGNFNQPNAVHLNDGDGNPFDSAWYSFGSGGVDMWEALALGDVDGDGDLDLMVGKAQSGVSSDLDLTVANSDQQNVIYLNRNYANLSITTTVTAPATLGLRSGQAGSGQAVSAAPGDPVTYTLTFVNAGPKTATGVVISDVVVGERWSQISSQESLVGGQIARTDGATFEWTVSDLAPGQGGLITITGVLTSPLSRGFVFSNTASITTTAIDTDTTCNSASAEVTVANGAPLAVDDSGTGYATGEGIPFITGDVLANDDDPNGDALAVDSFDASGALGLVSDNGDGTFTYTPTVSFTGMDAFTYTVSDGELSDTATVNVEVQLVSDLSIGQSFARDAGVVTYTVVARNLGLRAANGAVVTSDLSANVSGVSWTCVAASGANCTTSGTGNTISDTLASFPAGGVVTYTVSGALAPSDNAVNSASIAPPVGLFDPDVDNNSDTLSTANFQVFLPLVLKQP